jgi:predicted permease
MRWLVMLQNTLSSLFHRQQREADLDSELRDHLEQEIAANIAAGMSSAEARFAAQRLIGSISLYKEECREAGGTGFIDKLGRDLTLTSRMLRRSPVFTVAAVLTLGLAIGANAAIFSITNQLLLRLLPVKDPNRLVLFNWHGDFIGGSSRGFSQSFSYPAYRDLRDGNPGVFTGIAAQYQDTVDVSARDAAERAVAEVVSGNYFQVLGVQSAIGRVLTANDDRVKNAEPYVVLTYEYWRRRFGGNPSLLNRVIYVNGYPMTVVGVSQRGFSGFNRDSPSDIFIPMMMKATVTPTWDDMERRNSIWLHIFGRLAPAVTPKRAGVAMSLPFRHVLEQDLASTADSRPRDFADRYMNDSLSFSDAAKGNTSFGGVYAKPLFVLLGMVGVLLLIACANVANLLIARGAARQREVAIRLSLGATRASLVRLFLTETFCIALLGELIACVLSVWLVRALVAFLPFENMRSGIYAKPDLAVFAFTTGITVVTALLFGLIPALQATRINAPTVTKERTSTSATVGQMRARQALISIQVALSLVLLFAAGLYARSLHALMTADSGMNMSRVVQFTIDPALHRYTSERSRQFFLELQTKISRIPGVACVSASSVPLLASDNSVNTVHVEGYRPHNGEDMNPGFNQTLPGFFATMGVPLIAGRDFSQTDTGGAHQVAIVNESFVKRFIPHGNPIGLHFGFGGDGPIPFEIIGIVKDFKSGADLREEPRPFTFFSLLQAEKPGETTYYLRTASKVNSTSIRRALHTLDPSLPIYDFKTLERQIDETQFVDRLFAWLSSAFGILATLLAAIGLYGITSYAVTRRTREIGIRVALGARKPEVFRIVIREVMLLTLLGLCLGAPLLYWAARITSAELYGIKPGDAGTIASAILIIITVSALAGLVPARRAAKINPIEALRYE